MRFSFINALFDDGKFQTHKQQGGSCNGIYDGDDDNDLITISKNDDRTLSSASRMSQNLDGNDFTGNDNKIIHDFLNDVEENKEDDELFSGMNELVSLAGDGGGGTLSNSAATGSGLSCSSSSSRTSTKMIFSPMDKDDCNSAAIPIVATSTSTPIGLLEETCHQLGQIEVDGDDRQQRIYGHGGEKVEPDTSVSVNIKEEVLVDRFQNADQDDLDAIMYKQVEQLSIKDRMDGCKEAQENVMKFVPHLVSNQVECFQKLQSYVIPTSCIPQDDIGNVLLDDHMEWIQRQRAREEEYGNNIPAVITGPPRKFDVLLGRGKITSAHAGNLRLFHIVDMNRSTYESLGKFEKTQLSTQIVQLVNQCGGRFLKKKRKMNRRICRTSKSMNQQVEQWIEVSKDEAREKISHCFRRLRELDATKNRNGAMNTESNDGSENKAKRCASISGSSLGAAAPNQEEEDVTASCSCLAAVPSNRTKRTKR